MSSNTPIAVLKQLATTPRNRHALKVTTAAERQLRQGHPWIFESSIVKQPTEGKAGDLAIIYDRRKNKLLAVGLHDPFSPIRIRVLSWQASLQLDTDWFYNRFQEAYAKRASLFETDTNSYRLIYGENDGLSGLIIDVYDQVAVVKLYSASWLPYLALLLDPLQKISGCRVIILRLSRLMQALPQWPATLTDGCVLLGTLDDEKVHFQEHGLRFTANVIRGHKTGYFLDHRHNRFQIGKLAVGKTVLDVFAYAGGFSVHALAGGAKAVTSLDISAQALAVAQSNVALNASKGHHQVMVADAFKALTQLEKEGQTYDIVIIDPPAFAKRKSEVPTALRQYARLAAMGAQLIAKGGILLLASCSSRVTAEVFYDTVLEALRQKGRPFTEWKRTEHDVDHPITFPEGAYLKSIYLRF